MRAHPMAGRALTVSLALTVWVCCWYATLARADIYWVGGIHGVRIERATDGGAHVDRSFISGLTDVGAIATGHGYVYWTSGTSLGRARVNGTDVNRGLLRDLGALNGVAVAGGHVYWLSERDRACGGRPGFGRATLDGAGVQPGFVCGVTDSDYANGIGVRGKYLYWSWLGGIGRLDTTTRHYVNRFVTLPKGYTAAGVTVGDSGIYWGSYDPGPAIGRAALDGRHVDPTFVSGLAGNIAPEVTVTNRYLYFGNDYGDAATIARADLSGAVEWDFVDDGLDVVGDLVVLG